MEKVIKVLLADDSEHFGKPCAAIMRAHSLDVHTVQKDGRQVLSFVEQMRPDVVIMDFFLPHLDAIGVLKGIQRMNLATRPQVMIMSSFDNPNLEREALLAGADYYFLKPFDADEMAERILALNGKRRVEMIRRGGIQGTPSIGSLEMRVTEIIHQIGVPAHIKGYQYLRGTLLLWRLTTTISSTRLQSGFIPRLRKNTAPLPRVLSAQSGTRLKSHGTEGTWTC